MRLSILSRVFVGVTTAIMMLVSVQSLYLPAVLANDFSFPYNHEGGSETQTSNFQDMLKDSTKEGSLLSSYLTLFGINYEDKGQGKAIVYVQVVINYVLAVLGIIATAVILYSFYAIFFSSKSETAIDNAKKTVIGAFIALALIGLSAYIVNFIFYIYNKGT